MATTSNTAANILCPFYRGNTPFIITCEGLRDGCDVHLIFPRKVEMLRHKEIFCCGRPHYCELYPAIDSKYAREQPPSEC